MGQTNTNARKDTCSANENRGVAVKALDVLKTIGTGLISSNPYGAAALTVVNAFLPDDKKLPTSATGEQAMQAVEQLSGAEKAQIAIAEIDLKKADIQGQTDRYVAMTKADGQKTRAKIVLIAMYALIAISLIFIIAVAFVYYKDGAALAFSTEMALVFITVSGTFAYVIRAYFGDLKVETTSRHATSNNRLPKSTGIAGVVEALRKK
jgi:hypothetical protein